VTFMGFPWCGGRKGKQTAEWGGILALRAAFRP